MPIRRPPLQKLRSATKTNSSKADADDATLSNRLELGAENRCSGLFAIGKVVKFAFRRACFVRRQRGVVAIER